MISPTSRADFCVSVVDTRVGRDSSADVCVLGHKARHTCSFAARFPEFTGATRTRHPAARLAPNTEVMEPKPVVSIVRGIAPGSKVEVANADFSSAHVIGGYGYLKNPAWSLDDRLCSTRACSTSATIDQRISICGCAWRTAGPSLLINEESLHNTACEATV